MLWFMTELLLALTIIMTPAQTKSDLPISGMLVVLMLHTTQLALSIA